MNFPKCALYLLAWSAMSYFASCSASEEESFFERGYRALNKVYEECQSRNMAVSPCLKKKAIVFFERLGRIESMPIGENLELVKVAPTTAEESGKSAASDLEATLGRTTGGATRDEILNDILYDRVASLMNSFNIQIRLPRTSSGELKRSMVEGRGKMKKMMGMMMMGVAMKMAALVPIAMMVLFLLAGKALIISKIALVISLIIGLKKLLSQKQQQDHHHGWQQSSGWDRSLKAGEFFGSVEPAYSPDEQLYAHNLAYGGQRQRR